MTRLIAHPFGVRLSGRGHHPNVVVRGKSRVLRVSVLCLWCVLVNCECEINECDSCQKFEAETPEAVCVIPYFRLVTTRGILLVWLIVSVFLATSERENQCVRLSGELEAKHEARRYDNGIKIRSS